MDLDAWLARIGYRGPLAVDAATLAGLQRAHLLAVPFENLDIHWGVPIALDLEVHYDKIVRRGRGGFCYELNGLFGWALATIGFPVTRLGAGVWKADAGDFSDPSSHLLLRVDLDGPWIADVGFGENYRTPLRLADGVVQEQPPRAYRLDRDDAGRHVLSSRDETGAWTPGYRFADEARPLDWFAARCAWQQTSPDSHFTRKPLCSLATPTGRITLSGREWIESGLDGAKTVTAVEDDAHAARLLRERFGIVPP